MRMLGLAVWLGLPSLLSYVVSETAAHGWVRGVLGWSLSPGPWILVCLIVLGVYQVTRTGGQSAAQITLFFVASTLVEFAWLPRPFCSYAGLILAIFANARVYADARRIGIPEVSYMVVSAYIQSVHMFDLLPMPQMMYFFKEGWIA